MAVSCSLYCLPALNQGGFEPRNADKNEDERIEATACIEKESVIVSSEALIPSDLERATYIDQPSTSPWHRIDSKCREILNRHGNYWWQSSGYALAILLRNAGYSSATQVRTLDFFARCIAPMLGIANEPGVERWKSFMTDDHNPIEFSWDWHTGHKPPTIRFSMEPVGQEAGTVKDPRNEHAAGEFTEAILKELPATNVQWFDHFESYFSLGIKHQSPLGHQSKIFWAFDLDEKDVTAKAYFFPGYRACATQKTNIQVISEAIESAPSCTSEGLSALYMFQGYTHELPLEMDMLAIDLVEPSQSRFKIYFRTRETSFQSVCKAMTLGGRLTNSEMDVGLRSLRRLWDSLFNQHGVSDDSSLPASKHRTAGILYNIEFRPGTKVPKIKAYIPVRHYAQNDWQIMNTVSDFMYSVKVSGVAQLGESQAYSEAMCSIFGQDTLRRQKGIQTYLGCSVQQGGVLRVVSYFNPHMLSVHNRSSEQPRGAAGNV